MVWLLNNDAFPEPECLSHLRQALVRDPKLAAVTPLLHDSNGQEQHAGAILNWRTFKNSFVKASEEPACTMRGRWIPGTAPLFRAPALRKVGLFDRRFFAYWEDVDLCIRLTKRGFRVGAVAAARCRHDGGASTGGSASRLSVYLDARNRLLLCRKYLRGLDRAGATLVIVRDMLHDLGRSAPRGELPGSLAALEGTMAGLFGESGLPTRLGKTGWIARLVARHPWRSALFLDQMVSWIALLGATGHSRIW